MSLPESLSRREFIRRTGVTVAAASALPLTPRALAMPAAPGLPPHHALAVPGVHAYPMEHSVAAGGTLELCVSASVPYRFSICRLGPLVDDPMGDTVLVPATPAPANPQPIHPGSYVHVDRGLPGGPQPALTLECWVRPWDITKLQGVISQEDKDSDEGFALGIGEGGYVGFFLGDGVSPDEKVVHRTAPGVITRNTWHHLVATWDGKQKRVFVDGKETGAWDFAGPLMPGKHAMRLGAMGRGGAAIHFLDGDLAMPVVYERALNAEEVRGRFALKGLEAAHGPGVVACWPLAEERGSRVADVSGGDRHGRIINHGTWMIGGPGFQADVPRFGN